MFLTPFTRFIQTHLVQFCALIFSAILVFGIAITPLAHAQNCVGDVKVTAASVFVPASFTPIIPKSCSGSISPINLTGIMLRGYGFLSSVVMYLFFFYVVYTGVLYAYSGMNQSAMGQVRKNFENGLWALGLTWGAYIIVNTFVIYFIGANLDTDLNKFFTTGNIN
jgi:hypothetical protein